MIFNLSKSSFLQITSFYSEGNGHIGVSYSSWNKNIMQGQRFLFTKVHLEVSVKQINRKRGDIYWLTFIWLVVSNFPFLTLEWSFGLLLSWWWSLLLLLLLYSYFTVQETNTVVSILKFLKTMPGTICIVALYLPWSVIFRQWMDFRTYPGSFFMKCRKCRKSDKNVSILIPPLW